MLTYQVRPRVFHSSSGEPLSFPANCEVRFHFKPLQPFGVEPGGGRTAVQATPASVLFDANTGASTITSDPPLSVVQVVLQEPARRVEFEGNVLRLQQTFQNLSEVEAVIAAVYFILPTLLNVPFADPPFVVRVDGELGGTPFRWQLQQWQCGFRITTQEAQEQAISTAWERLGFTCGNRRLSAALHYFHVACRLARVSVVPGEFVAEVILNLAKALESIFPPGSRDAVRSGLRHLEFTADEIEGNLLPAMVLRNYIDVAHVELALFSADQLSVIHAFTERAECAFREMFGRILSRSQSGQFVIADYELRSPSRGALEVVERLRRHTPKGALGNENSR
jgi:hypothetical protein